MVRFKGVLGLKLLSARPDLAPQKTATEIPRGLLVAARAVFFGSTFLVLAMAFFTTWLDLPVVLTATLTGAVFLATIV